MIRATRTPIDYTSELVTILIARQLNATYELLKESGKDKALNLSELVQFKQETGQ